jgi:hypothetical protein
MAMGEVEKSLASPSGRRVEVWAKALEADLEKLAEALELHITSTEAPGGILDDIVATAPRLAERVEQARREHEALRYRLHAAMQALPVGPEGDAHGTRDRVVEVLTGIVHHRHLGADLVFDAYDVDIEAVD